MLTATVDPIVAGLGGAAIAAAGAYITAVRRFSGRIETSAASELWEESRSIREWSASRIAELTGEVQGLEARVKALEASNTDLTETLVKQRIEIAELKVKLRAARAQLSVSREEVDELTRRLRDARQHIEEIEGRASGG